MKKLFLLPAAIVLFFLLAGCNATQPEQTQPTTQPAETAVQETMAQILPITCEPAEPLEYFAVMEELTQKRKDQLAIAGDWSGLEAYVGEKASLVTGQEWKKLTDPNNPRNEFVTYDEAVADIDLLFRAYEEAYGAYHYFGAEKFRQAKDEILHWLEGQETVVSPELHQIYMDSMQFLADAHNGSLEPGSEGYMALRHDYYYAEGWEFAKDEAGFYATADGVKWYVAGFSSDLISVEYKLCSDGRIVYAPVLFCTASEANPCQISLENGNGDVLTQEITWTKGGSRIWNSPDVQCWEENGIAYLSVRSFARNQYGRELQNDFVPTGSKLKDAKLVILDLRGNHGGDSRFGSEWIYNLTGNWAVARQGTMRRGNALAKLAFPGMKRTGNTEAADGKFMENHVPIVVLVDDKVASSGETMMQELSTMENVMVVGSNTMGCTLCGNVVQMQLPNTGIPFSLGVDLFFANDALENMDYRGLTPDVWCDPAVSVDSVLNMLQYYGLAEEATVGALKEKEASRPGMLTLGFLEWTVMDGEMYGTDEPGIHETTVFLNGEPIEDFTVESGSEWVTVTKKGATIQYENLQTGTGNVCPITVTAGKDSATFLWFAG